MRAELIRLHKRLTQTTTVYVTHDQIEALTMGDRVAVLKDGDVHAVCDTPSGLYENPANSFVATFIGSPKMNLVPGEFTGRGRRPSVTLLGAKVALASRSRPRPCGPTAPTASCQVGMRPADLRPPADVAGSAHTARLQGIVDVVEHSGSEIFAISPRRRPAGVRALPAHDHPRGR